MKPKESYSSLLVLLNNPSHVFNNKDFIPPLHYGDEKINRVALNWASKEAVVKCIGEGLSIPPNLIRVDFINEIGTVIKLLGVSEYKAIMIALDNERVNPRLNIY
ncbi:hypothetical protein O9G_002622 [Rozella allomycis CSF55]|uniref:4'-phosphopantetheinyl transferase domain-containing protein n=1 Tax=Rozella allomycis (strain CSF55) TaxID=988480 RepID=A0A075AUF6_ROZAC|nr:hypothetical protein O9G_002622 [Rozella allomycis CSF55]|eukprot:EPZ32127.1 hypothetical protein O9G_002622 [Rozella allomycis CSF55]